MPSLPEAPLRVTVIGENVRTIESLRHYLSSAGVDSFPLHQLPLPEVPVLGDAIIIFPDEFETDAVLRTVAAIQRARPRLRVLLVTSSPQRFQLQRLSDGQRPPLLLPKPAFGWSILDAIRDASSSDEASS